MKVLLTLCALFLSTAVNAAALKDIVVFGDSLSDNGNLYEYMHHQLPQSPPYYEGRFTNGPLWVERLLALYYKKNPNSHLKDYAFGGAGVSEEDDGGVLFTLRSEIESYFLTHHQAEKNNLYVVWIGANNYLGVPEDVNETVARVNKGIANGLRQLADKGARHILVFNLPDLGKAPAAKDFEAEDILSEFCRQHNAALANTMRELKAEYPKVQWIFYDVNELLNNIFADPARYGFNNVDQTCYDVMIEKPSQKSVLEIASRVHLNSEQDSCEGFLFFDPVHPTAPAHQIMAETAYRLLKEADISFGNSNSEEG
ncbi:lysophospholipase A [Legionella birminghamensis]|uniref:Lysophospholipase A n=1 Tax=Legionella birminghamensis TaxID=28083 RepID=A0A378IDI3_9GAMM|nr:SGNH/GDSL hydrolase family protein [Legionella birminghamensis]KTC74291.1 lysophospholipase A [Legionella birminghamensis]STX32591.1 lysophospholipase A [Legionella birminghamensis]